MNLYTFVLFLHVLGALGVFAGLALEWTGLRQLRRAGSADAIRSWLVIFGPARRLTGPSFGILLLTGFYLTSVLRGSMSWVILGLVSLVALGALGGGLTGRHMRRIHRELANGVGDEGSVRVRELVQQPRLWLSLQLRTAIALAVVFLMTNKPGWLGSLVVMGGAVGVALIAGPLFWRKTQVGVTGSGSLAEAGRP